MIDQNRLAEEVARLEGGKQNLSIAQIKEVIRCTFIALHKSDPRDVLLVIEKVAKAYDQQNTTTT